MACAQTSSLFLTEGRLLEGEKELAYWCMPAILYSLFFFISLFTPFWYFDSFPPLFSFFLKTCSCGGVMILF